MCLDVTRTDQSRSSLKETVAEVAQRLSSRLATEAQEVQAIWLGRSRKSPKLNTAETHPFRRNPLHLDAM